MLRCLRGDTGSVAVKEGRSQVVQGLECLTEEGIPEEHGITLRLEDSLPQHPPAHINPQKPQEGPVSIPSVSSGVVLPNRKHTIHLHSLLTDMHVDRV